MIPDYQTLMRPVLENGLCGPVAIRDVVDRISEDLNLTDDERTDLLPSGKQTVIANRIHWAKTYLKQAGLVRATKRGHYDTSDRGKEALASEERIDNEYLKRFEEFRAFQKRSSEAEGVPEQKDEYSSASVTPDEALRAAHQRINDNLATELLDRVRGASPAFFERLIVNLLVGMGYGGTNEDAGRALGRSGDDGIDGVIDQDPLGVDQIYLQAKRYQEGSNISSGAIRDFYGALSLQRATKGIFVTTSEFTASATDTARNLGNRLVLIDGAQLSHLMVLYNIGCQTEDILHIKKLDEDFFD